MQNSRGKGWELPSAGIQVMPDAQMGRQGRKFLLEGPEKIPTHKDRKIRFFSTWDAHNRQSNRMQRVRQGAGGGRLKGKSTFFVLKLQTIIKCNKLEKAVITYIICVEVQDVHRTEV